MQLGPADLVRISDDLLRFMGDGVLDRAVRLCNHQPANFTGGLEERFGQSLEYFNTQVRLAEFLGNIIAANPGARPNVDDWLRRIEEPGAARQEVRIAPTESPQHDVRLISSQRSLLREAIQKSFDPATLTMFLTEALDKRFDDYAGAEPFPVAVFKIIDGSMRDGWTAALIAALARAHPHRREFRELADAFNISR